MASSASSEEMLTWSEGSICRTFSFKTTAQSSPYTGGNYWQHFSALLCQKGAFGRQK